MSQPERKLARVWRPPVDVRAEHEKKLAHLTVAEKQSLRKSLEGQYLVLNHRALKDWKRSGYDPSKKQAYDQFNIETGWFWNYKKRMLQCAVIACSSKTCSPVRHNMCILPCAGHQHKWEFIFAGEVRAAALCLPPLVTTAGGKVQDVPGKK